MDFKASLQVSGRLVFAPPGLSRNMMASIAEFSLIPEAPGTRILSGKPTTGLRTKMFRKRYETLSCLSTLMSAGTPEDWIRDLSTDLRNMLPIDLLEVVIYKNDGDEVQWRSSTAEQTAVNDVPIEEGVLGWVHRYQHPLWIAACDAEEGYSLSRQRLKNLAPPDRSPCDLPLSPPS